ncbi:MULTISPECIES: hypothetical protein [Nostocales]|uniref:Uncharacterized protein n=1 Tax=Tolypothrix bouteillei VB521301 TaxID=1479485 RepID=A0A8S9TBC5_9CYAN|nr:hypothetical protein [Tolypothrix bouteillei]KAF3889357.1 hypothetical protein DA73_0400030675 [Tolypothrix bouteillei VB521301]
MSKNTVYDENNQVWSIGTPSTRRQKYDGRGATAVDGFHRLQQVAWQKAQKL